MRLAQALAQARACGVPRLDAQLLLAAVLQRPRAWLLAHEDEVLTDAQASAYLAGLRRRADGEPLAYIVGEKEFHGLMLRVDPRVLVPRPDTETLVDWALQLLHGPLADIGSPRVIDLGTGSGAIALAVKKHCARAEVVAVDVSAQALELARANGLALGLAVQWRLGRWWTAVAGQRFHLALSNPPYIAEGDPHLRALGHEPAIALTAGPDGLQALREVIAQAPAHLEPGGWLVLEHGHDQAPAVRELLAQSGFSGIESRPDLAGMLRCSAGQCAACVTLRAD